MTALIAKDLRLSLDALRPWTLVLFAVLSVWLVALWLGPLATGVYADANRILGELGAILTISSGFVAAWITACVVHGDQSHRADGLAAAMPVGRGLRLLAKVLSIIAACSVPIGITVLVQIIRSRQGGITLFTPDFGRSWQLPIVAALIGVGLTLGVAPLTRRIFETVGLAFLAALTATALAGGTLVLLFPLLAARPIRLLGDDAYTVERCSTARSTGR